MAASSFSAGPPALVRVRATSVFTCDFDCTKLNALGTFSAAAKRLPIAFVAVCVAARILSASRDSPGSSARASPTPRRKASARASVRGIDSTSHLYDGGAVGFPPALSSRASVGVDEIAIVLPPGLPSGPSSVVLTADGQSSNLVTLSVP